MHPDRAKRGAVPSDAMSRSEVAKWDELLGQALRLKFREAVREKSVNSLRYTFRIYVDLLPLPDALSRTNFGALEEAPALAPCHRCRITHA